MRRKKEKINTKNESYYPRKEIVLYCYPSKKCINLIYFAKMKSCYPININTKMTTKKYEILARKKEVRNKVSADAKDIHV